MGDTITFTLSGVTVTDGQKRENCVVVGAPVDVTYEWIIGHPPGGGISVGKGPVATVQADAPGQYWCTFYAIGTSDCPVQPPYLSIPDITTAVAADLDVDSNNDGSIDPDNSPTGTDDPIEAEAYPPQTPGKWGWPNNAAGKSRPPGRFGLRLWCSPAPGRILMNSVRAAVLRWNRSSGRRTLSP